MKNPIDLKQNRLDHVVPDQLEAGIAAHMGNVGPLAAEEIIEANDFVLIL